MSFTPEQTAQAIRGSKASKAFGPDNLTMIHLKHYGPAATAYLTALFNLSLKTSTIPDIWKQSVIVPLLKPGKDPEAGKSYRPVSLLSPAIKVLERLLLPTHNTHLQPADTQHGFRPKHSTVTALHQLNHAIAKGVNRKRPPQRTMVVALDLSKAFDSVSHNKLITDLLGSSLPGSVTRWLSAYLRGRQSRVLFPWRQVKI